MKNTFLAILSISIILFSCSNQNNEKDVSQTEKINLKDSIQKEMNTLNLLLKKYKDSPELLKASCKKITKLTGKKGSIIFLDPANFETENGQEVTSDIDIELLELTSTEDFVKSNTQTISDNKLLVSDGAYYVNMTSDGKQLKLKNGKTFKMSFPQNSDDGMSLFYGTKDSLDNINWKDAEQKLITKKLEPISKEQTLEVQMVTWQKDTVRGKHKKMTKEEMTKADKELALLNRVYILTPILRTEIIGC